MNGWCLLLVCLGVAPVQGHESEEFLIEKFVQFFRVADRNGDGNLVFDDYNLILKYFLITPGYNKCSASYLFDVIAVNAWGVFPNQNMTRPEFLEALLAKDSESMKNAMNNLTRNMFIVWDFKPPFHCLTAEEIKWGFKNLGKVNDVARQAQLALNAMTKSPFGICATLRQYQSLADEYFTVRDQNHNSKYFFGYLGKF